MPAGVVKTGRDEHLWTTAKQQAAKAGRAKDYAYIMGIFKKMKGDVEKAEQLRGGEGDDRPDSAFHATALQAGMRVEREHSKDPRVAKEIAKDHLTEDPKYYEKLKRVEKARSDKPPAMGSPVRAPAPPAVSTKPLSIPKPPAAREPGMEKAMDPLIKSVLTGKLTLLAALQELPGAGQTRMLRDLRKAKQQGLFGDHPSMRGVRGPKPEQMGLFGGGDGGGGGGAGTGGKGAGSRGGHVIGTYPDGSPRYADKPAAKPYGKHPTAGTEGPPQSHGEGWEPVHGSKEGGWKRKGEVVGKTPDDRPVHHVDHWFPGGKEKQPSLFGKGEPSADELEKKYMGEWTPSGIKPGKTGAAPAGMKPGEAKPLGKTPEESEAHAKKLGLPSATGEAHPKGEGSRGGQVSGHSASGKPIYGGRAGAAKPPPIPGAPKPPPIPGTAKSLAKAILRGEETLAKAMTGLGALDQLDLLRELRLVKAEQLGLFGGAPATPLRNMGKPVSADPTPGVGTAGGAGKAPQGYQAVPGSKHGGFRKRQGAGYVYWYPGAGHQLSPHPSDQHREAAERHDRAAAEARAKGSGFSDDSEALTHERAASAHRAADAGTGTAKDAAVASRNAGGIPGETGSRHFAPLGEATSMPGAGDHPVRAPYAGDSAARRHEEQSKRHADQAAALGAGDERGFAHTRAANAHAEAAEAHRGGSGNADRLSTIAGEFSRAAGYGQTEGNDEREIREMKESAKPAEHHGNRAVELRDMARRFSSTDPGEAKHHWALRSAMDEHRVAAERGQGEDAGSYDAHSHSHDAQEYEKRPEVAAALAEVERRDRNLKLTDMSSRRPVAKPAAKGKAAQHTELSQHYDKEAKRFKGGEWGALAQQAANEHLGAAGLHERGAFDAESRSRAVEGTGGAAWKFHAAQEQYNTDSARGHAAARARLHERGDMHRENIAVPGSGIVGLADLHTKAAQDANEAADLHRRARDAKGARAAAVKTSHAEWSSRMAHHGQQGADALDRSDELRQLASHPMNEDRAGEFHNAADLYKQAADKHVKAVGTLMGALGRKPTTAEHKISNDALVAHRHAREAHEILSGERKPPKPKKVKKSMQPGAKNPPGKDPLMKKDTSKGPMREDELRKKRPPPQKGKPQPGQGQQFADQDPEAPQPGSADYHKDQAMKHLAAAQAHANAHHSAKKIAETGDHDEKVKAADEASAQAIVKKGGMMIDLGAEADVLSYLEGGGQVGSDFATLPNPRGVQRLAALRGGIMQKAEKVQAQSSAGMADDPGAGVAGGTIYQGEWNGPRGGDMREATMRLKEQLMTVEDDPAGSRGQGGLDEWWRDAYGKASGIETDVNVPVGPMSMVRKSEDPAIQIINDDDPYTRALYRADPRDGAAGLRMAYQGGDRDKERRGQ